VVVFKAAKILIVVLVGCAMAYGQSVDQKAQQPAPAQSSAAATNGAPASRPNPTQQMQLDLDQMDSLVNNMAAQVSFIHDTNMSILLNTNVRLWMVLIRDLRLQLQEQQKHVALQK
jgi:hypothetical protein